VPTSNTPEDDDWADFDLRQFVLATVKSIEYGDAMNSVLEERVIRLEEIVAARWPRSWFLRRRLRREIRASVDSWDPRYIPKGDFRTRRYEAVSLMSSDLYDRQAHAQADWGISPAQQGDEDRQQGDADPGEGLLP
jgi:hypothetical protein